MRQSLRFALACLVFLGLLARPPYAARAAPRLEVIHSFPGIEEGGGDGRTNAVVASPAGTIYGTSRVGGVGLTGCPVGCGSIYRLLPPAAPGAPWVYERLHAFDGVSEGADPAAVAPVLDDGGNLYGVASVGGAAGYVRDGGGGVWRLSPPSAPAGAWTFEVLHRFSGSRGNPFTPDGFRPNAPLVRDRAGSLYGRTSLGGPSAGAAGFGTVFQLSPPAQTGAAWTYTVLRNFTTRDYANALPLALSPDEQSLFGVETCGAQPDCVFELRRDAVGGGWSHQVVYRFDSAKIQSNLVVDEQHALFGLAAGIGPLVGTNLLVRLSPPGPGQTAWSRSDLVAFPSTTGFFGTPSGNITRARGGAFFGASERSGDLNLGLTWRVDPPAAGASEWTLTTLHSFESRSIHSPTFPYGGLAPGPYQNYGGVFIFGGDFGRGGIFRQTTR